jgi:pimeloyl-ACP methyl ester carboxylesterase
VLLALHGITASAISLQPVADRLCNRFAVVAPDLRGRGRSAGLGGPFGMSAHATDCVAVLDHLGAPQASVLGESMGGYAAVQLALDHPARVRQLFLIDGGLPLAVPPGVDADTLLAHVLGPALDRLQMTFESREQYGDFWRGHPAFRGEEWTRYLEDYFDADLGGAPPALRSVVDREAVLADGRDQIVNSVPGRLAAIECPVTLVRAPRNLADEPQPLFPDAIVAAARAELPQLVDRVADDVNHYTLFLTARGADAIADAVGATAIP